jgi:biopolymer transport protein ExbB/TolQ
MSIWEMFHAGDSLVLGPLLIFSLLIWGIAIEKVWTLRRFRQQLRSVSPKAQTLILENKFNESRGLLSSVDPLVAKPFIMALEARGKEKDVWEGRVRRQFTETQEGLKRYLWILGTIASSAPFIGLFGTVIGIINSFASIAQAGKSGFTIVSADLAEALVATAAGIGVAVVAVIFYNIFQVQIKKTLLEYRHQLEDFIDQL